VNREADAQEQIAAAREEPPWFDPLIDARGSLDSYIRTAPDDFEGHLRAHWADRYALLSGDELVAYRKLQEIARAAQGAQEVMVRTGGALREAIAGLCAVLAPAVKP
jgi:hypothetical protein